MQRFYYYLHLRKFFSQITGGPTVGSGATASEFEMTVDGEEFFPIGWYLTDKDDLQMAYDAGANVVLFYWNSIWVNYNYTGCKNSGGYNITEYKVRLECFLNDIEALNSSNDHDMKVLVDLDLKRAGRDEYTKSGDIDTLTYGFNQDSILDLVTEIENDYSDILFGWYVLDEPTQNTDLTPSDSTPHPREFYHDITKEIKDSSDFPIIVVFTNPEAFEEHLPESYLPNVGDSSVFERVHYDILARDEYGYSYLKRKSENSYSDENNVSRLAAVRSMKTLQNYESGDILDLDNDLTKKMAFMTVAMTHDLFEANECLGDSGVAGDKDCFDQVDENFMVFQSMAPIIRGARALMYYWYNPDGTKGGRQSTLDLSEDFVKTFTSNRLDSVILKGEILDNSLEIEDFELNGYNDFLDDYTWNSLNNSCTLPNYTACSPAPSNQPDEPMFDWMIRKYNSSYYIFAVNEFDLTVSATFNIGDILSSNEMAYQITELDMLDPSQNTQINFNNDNKIKASGSSANISSFNSSFDSLEVKVFKIDILKLSNEKYISGLSTNTLGGGLTTGQFDADDSYDLIAMSIDDGSGANEMRYKVCWDLSVSGTGALSCNVHSTYYPSSSSYGTFPGIAWNTKGGDIEAYPLGGTTSQFELFSLGVNESTSDYDFRVKLKWDMTTSGNIYATDNSFTNFYYPDPRGDGRLNVGSDSDLITGAGMDITDIDSNGHPEIFIMYIDENASSSNPFKYYVVNDFYSPKTGEARTYNESPGTFVIDGPYSTGAIGWDTKGADIAVGDIDNDGSLEMVFLGIEENTNEHRIIIKNLNSDGTIESTWRPHNDFELNSNTALSAGLDLADVDNDGDLDFVFLSITESASNNPFRIKVGVNGLISDGNNPFAAPASKINPGNNEEVTVTETPISYNLDQNYPNPFNPSTTISYSIKNSEQVTLEVFDIQGRKVATLVNERQNAGEYTFNFDASSLSSGIYLYRLTTNSFTQTRKLTLIK